MTRQQFKDQIRTNRGRLTSNEQELEDIYLGGTGDFIDFMLNTKHIGVIKASEIANRLTTEQQDEFVEFVEATKAKRNDIDLWLSERYDG